MKGPAPRLWWQTRRSLRRTLDDALGVINEQGDRVERLERTVAQQCRIEFTLRREVADLRRQNLALDHMTRVNQALDAGITTTTTQERT